METVPSGEKHLGIEKCLGQVFDTGAGEEAVGQLKRLRRLETTDPRARNVPMSYTMDRSDA